MAATCDSCGESVERLLATGTVVDFEFRPDFRYCEACYEKYRGHRDELNPRAVAEQKVPPLVSRPIQKSDPTLA